MRVRHGTFPSRPLKVEGCTLLLLHAGDATALRQRWLSSVATAVVNINMRGVPGG